jgi:hypothetical protein
MYRIVHNPQTGAYRIEKKGLFGWNFVISKGHGEYLQFDALTAARDWIRSQTARISRSPNRRWQVVTDCSA